MQSRNKPRMTQAEREHVTRKPKKISLRPYHGYVFVCDTRESLAAEYKR